MNTIRPFFTKFRAHFINFQKRPRETSPLTPASCASGKMFIKRLLILEQILLLMVLHGVVYNIVSDLLAHAAKEAATRGVL